MKSLIARATILVQAVDALQQTVLCHEGHEGDEADEEGDQEGKEASK